MRTLYHIWLSAQSRIVRLLLAEKDLHCDMKVERVWERREEFLALNPTGEVPLLIEPDGTTLTDVWVIVEYMEEMHPEIPLLGEGTLGRAETRRLLVWFDQKFGREVTENLVGEKFMKRVMRTGQPPSSDAIRAGRQHVHYHLEYISYLAEQRRWLAGDEFSLADIAAAAHLSVVDYLGDVPWDSHPEARQWYSRIKSRPSFRPLLEDHVPGIPAPAHYRDLDF